MGLLLCGTLEWSNWLAMKKAVTPCHADSEIMGMIFSRCSLVAMGP